MTDIEQAISTLVETLQNDEDYRRVWRDNISMAIQYTKDSDQGAELFLSWLCGEPRGEEKVLKDLIETLGESMECTFEFPTVGCDNDK